MQVLKIEKKQYEDLKILDEIQLLLTRESFDSKESALSIDGGGALRSAEQIYSLIH